MAVSYLSRPYESNPYVIPVDLNLLAKVNGYKQSMFYRNADAVTQNYTQMLNTDIANPQQAKLLQDKLGNLTSQLNSIGGIDYSDNNIVNQIQGFGAEVMADPVVRNGILSTKRMRIFQSNVEKMATDPKLSKYYNTSNITRIMQEQINPYVNGGKDASYNGPTAPRPYEGNPFEKMLKAMKNLPPNIQVQRLDSGQSALYNIQTQKFLSPEDISATFDGMIDANTKAQLADDAWYNFDYSTGGTFTKEKALEVYSGDQLNKKNQYRLGVDAIDIELASTIDDKVRTQLKARKDEYTKEIAKVDQEITTRNNTFSKLYDEDPQSAKYSLYVGNMRNAVIKAAGYSQDKMDYVKNEEYAIQKRFELEYVKHGLQLNSDGTVTPIPGWPVKETAASKKLKKDANGKLVVEDDPLSGFHELTPTFMNDAQTKALALTPEKIKEQNDVMRNQNNLETHAIIESLVKLNNWEDTMGYKTSVNTNNPNADKQSFQSDLITKIAGEDKLLDKEDITKIYQLGVLQYQDGKVDKNGNDPKTGKPYTYTVFNGGKNFGMTYDQMKIIGNLKQAWEKFGEGKIAELPESFNKGNFKEQFIQFAQKHADRELAISNKENYMRDVKTQALDDYVFLTPRQKEIYKDYLENPNKYGRQNKGGAVTPGGGPEITSFTFNATPEGRAVSNIIATFGKNGVTQGNVDDKIKKTYEVASKKLNYYEYTLVDDPKLLPQGLVNKIIGFRQKANNKLVAEPDDIRPVAISLADDGENYRIQYQYKKETTPQYATITAQEAMNFGIKPISNPELEMAFKYGAQESPKLFATSPQFDQPIFYTVKKVSNGFVPMMIYNGKKYALPFKTIATTASDAQEQIKTVASAGFQKYEDLISAVIPANEIIQ